MRRKVSFSFNCAQFQIEAVTLVRIEHLLLLKELPIQLMETGTGLVGVFPSTQLCEIQTSKASMFKSYLWTNFDYFSA